MDSFYFLFFIFLKSLSASFSSRYPSSPFFTSPGLVHSKPPAIPVDEGARLDGVLGAADGEDAVDARVPGAAVVGPGAGAHDVLARAARGDARARVVELEDELRRVRLGRGGCGGRGFVAQVVDRAEGEGFRGVGVRAWLWGRGRGWG